MPLNNASKMNKQHTFNFGYLFVALLIILGIQLWAEAQQVDRIPYSQFVQMLDKKEIASATVGDTSIQGTFKKPQDGKTAFVTERVDPDIAKQLEAAGVEYTGAPQAGWLSGLLSWILPTLFFVGIWFFLFRGFAQRQGLGGLMSIGQSKAKIYVEKETGVTMAS